MYKQERIINDTLYLADDSSDLYNYEYMYDDTESRDDVIYPYIYDVGGVADDVPDSVPDNVRDNVLDDVPDDYMYSDEEFVQHIEPSLKELVASSAEFRCHLPVYPFLCLILWVSVIIITSIL